jgi:hypothetical protein
MIKFDKHADALTALTAAQDADTDNRDRVREAHLFVNSRDGQWEPEWWNANEGKPRYTFDLTTPVVDQVHSSIEKLDFDIRITPAGGESTKQDAQLMDGIVRNIENISNSKAIFNMAGRSIAVGGLGAWVIKQKFVDDNSFDQDLVIEPLANVVDSVWFGPFKHPDGRDMRHCFVLEGVPKADYEERWPEGSGKSVDQARDSQAFQDKHDQIIVGQAYWMTEKPRVLNLMSDGRILEDTEENQSIMDELAAGGITVVDSRVVKKNIVKTRLFDGGDWLNEEQETVFNEIPVIPVLANFEIFEDKLLYHGTVEKLMDAQRVFNYSKSREIEEGALAPRAKYWMTPKQAQGHEKKLATLNTNADPMQFFNPDPENPGPPQQQGGAQINPGLQTIAQNMQEIMRGAAGLYAANMGDNPGLQSGVAIEKLQQRGNAGANPYIQAMELAVARTGRILVNAIPKVYDTRRTIRILKEDGTYDMEVVNDIVVDQQTGTPVRVNDLAKGKYDVVCKAGPSFDNRQQETVSALTEMAQVDPSIMELGGDILYQNLSTPGMDKLAERKRQQLFQAGLIPIEQMTEQEQMLMQQQMQQEPPPDPAMLMAQAEMEKAQADRDANQVKLAIEQKKVELESFKLQLQQTEQQIKQAEIQLRAARESSEIETQQLENAVVRQKFGLEVEQQAADIDETRSKTTLNLARAGESVSKGMIGG